MLKKQSGIVIVVVFLVVAVVVGGGWWLLKDKEEGPVVPVTVRLKWLHQSQFAGHYVADQKGYYQEEGLAVTLEPFDYVHFPIEEVVSGKAEFGVTGADELLIARSQGEKVKALAVIYQENPIVAYAFKSSGISKPTDFIGKRVGMEKGVNVETIIRAMLKAQGIDYQKDITEIPIGFEIDPLLNHEVDIATGYVTNEPIQVEEAGYEVNVIAPYKYGVKLYADVLFTTEEMIENHPDRVRGFVEATLRGWEYALSHVDEAVELTLLYKDPNNPALNYAHQKALLERSVSFIKPNINRKIGLMSFVDWKRTYELLREYDVLVDDQEVSEAYTSEYLK